MGSSGAPDVRVYSPFFPFPPTEGGRWVVAEQVRALIGLGRTVELVTWLDSPGTVRAAARTAVPPALDAALRVRHPGAAGGEARPVPEWRRGDANAGEPDRGAGAEGRLGRAARVARSAFSKHASPELFHYPPAADPREGLPRAELGIYHYTFAHAWLADGPPAPERTVAVHVHNRESEIAWARGRAARGPARWMHRRNARRLERHEHALPAAVDALWFVSRADLDAWRPYVADETIRFVPPTLPDLRHRTPVAVHRDEAVLGFVGTLDFEPNRRGVEWLVRVLAPELARLERPPRVVVAGRGLPGVLREEGERWGFFDFRGFVDDLETGFWGELSAFLVPDLHGIGVRIKLLEAVARGIPTLAHPTAAAALAPDVAESPLLTVADEPARWAEAIAGLGSRDAEPGRPPSLEGREVYAFLKAEAQGSE